MLRRKVDGYIGFHLFFCQQFLGGLVGHFRHVETVFGRPAGGEVAQWLPDEQYAFCPVLQRCRFTGTLLAAVGITARRQVHHDEFSFDVFARIIARFAFAHVDHFPAERSVGGGDRRQEVAAQRQSTFARFERIAFGGQVAVCLVREFLQAVFGQQFKAGHRLELFTDVVGGQCIAVRIGFASCEFIACKRVDVGFEPLFDVLSLNGPQCEQESSRQEDDLFFHGWIMLLFRFLRFLLRS